MHERLFVIDTHIDTPTASLMQPGWDFGARHDWKIDGSQCDLPRMAEGGADAMVFAIYLMQTSQSAEGRAVAHARAKLILQRTHEVATLYHDRCAIALMAEDGLRLKAEGKRAIYLSIENSHSLGHRIESVEEFYAQGIRMLGLTHLLNNDLADASTDPRGPEWGGLSPFGREVVAECNRLGIVLDASHASDAALDDLLRRSATPVILSHTGCRAVCDHPRNIGDELLRRLAAQGGVIQINALASALINKPDHGARAALGELVMRFKDEVPTPEVRAEISRWWARLDRDFPSTPATLADFIRHVEHAVEVAGIDHVGIGCDFDGGGGCEGLRDVTDYPAITRELLARGWTETQLAKLWGQNTLRVMKAAGR